MVSKIFSSSLLLFILLLGIGCQKGEIGENPHKEEVKKIFTAVVSNFEPAYLKLHRTGELKRRAEELWQIMESCRLCPRRCGVNRLKDQIGFCRAPGVRLYISSYHPHFGEERPLVGRGGSGTIFLTHCNLRCIFCQNWPISHLGRGSEADIEKLANMMLKLQEMGCHNINLSYSHPEELLLKSMKVL